MTFHPNGQLLVSGGDDQSIRWWDVTSGECLRVSQEHRGSIQSLTFSPDGRLLASSSNDRTIRLWDVDTGACIRVMTGHLGIVTDTVFLTETTTLLASCSFDETIRLWDLATGECLQILRPDRLYEGMDITEVTGLTETQKATLKQLGAIEDSMG
jgi:WD40 repeat protein